MLGLEFAGGGSCVANGFVGERDFTLRCDGGVYTCLLVYWDILRGQTIEWNMLGELFRCYARCIGFSSSESFGVKAKVHSVMFGEGLRGAVQVV